MRVVATGLLLVVSCFAQASGDKREAVELPPMMAEHMLSNMRDHLAAVNEILQFIGADDLDGAADIAETRLGMSALESHGASHMAQFMPEGMRKLGARMHRAASRFAVAAQEGEAPVAFRALSEVTAACVACHAAYRIH